MTTAPDKEVANLRQSLHITNQLLESLATGTPLVSLVHRMSKFCAGSALIYRADSQVLASSGSAPAKLIWQGVIETVTSKRQAEFEIGRWHVIGRKVSLHAGIHVIALASQQPETINRVATRLLDTAERLLSAIHGVNFEALREERRDKERLLVQLHMGVQPAQEHRVWAQLERFGFTQFSPIRVLTIANFSGADITDKQLSVLNNKARDEKIPLIIRAQAAGNETPESVHAVVPASQNAEAWISEINTNLLVGCSEEFQNLSSALPKFREAETALAIAKRLAARLQNPAAVPPVYLDRVDLATWTLSQVNSLELAKRQEQMLQLLAEAEISETVLTYLAHNQNIAATAKALFVHQNTVRYRLHRIEEVLGTPFSDPFTITNLTLCLHAQLLALKQTQ